ncbi:ADP-ribosylation factor-like protein 2-binding protein [Intoshia linei]|uniref:ADP-ribosylation factor-like protein 2-binding protein n=1 Tax=Intoshia linei TaxID=1819745 RepID=A0A177ARM4_9BILA|nr:ADP-ribosylation factor-like protein 2-binding protein [Intoshia linei]
MSNIIFSSSNERDTRFDSIIGYIEDIIMDGTFSTMIDEFMDKYCNEFDDDEENRLVYTQIHNEYIDIIEKYIERMLRSRIENFEIKDFFEELSQRSESLEGEIFEILSTFSDFMAFKDMILDYKASQKGDAIDLSIGIQINHLQDNI